ncbi:hypothetical protein KIN20_023402 [Parelaphostrongylus tenuis]|uniref:Uncharacterized protein n=1 Tax=Parelaphostrongylus tenuis TaxID=148309 RepID=A0AAD5N744_PARTN|nr:hypothetical protein KIN20_023402 [Parelaphostrongylus tenuis]
MATYDLESMIAKALNVSGMEQLYYIGHSQGTLTMFSKLSMDQVFSKKLHFHIFGARKFPLDNWISRLIVKSVCGGTKLEVELCDKIIFSLSGPENNLMNKTRIPVYTSNMPAGTSSMNIIHWMQMIRTGMVAKYDYGKRENIRRYGQIYKQQASRSLLEPQNTQHFDIDGFSLQQVLKYLDKLSELFAHPENTGVIAASQASDNRQSMNSKECHGDPFTANPPQYDFTQIQTPTYLYIGEEDWLADHKDIYGYLIPRIFHTLAMSTVLPKYTHIDFIWGLGAANDVYTPIIEIIKDEERKRITDN